MVPAMVLEMEFVCVAQLLRTRGRTGQTPSPARAQPLSRARMNQTIHYNNNNEPINLLLQQQ